ncbi:MAG: SDR family NAD(P)-dependent oxidoreductase [Candidatus Omnitrophota bacterium]
MPRPTSSKIILITGTSSGFGLRTAARLASRGHQVVATMRDPQKKEALLSEVKERGGDITVLPLDVCDPPTIDDAVREIGDRFGRIDILINNAGIIIGGFFEDLTQDEIRQVMETNFFGVQNVTRAVLPLMRPQGAGKIINISSISGQYASPAFGAYNASKWALEGFSESLYFELKPFGIDVVLIEPGAYKTKIFRENRRVAQNFDNPESPYQEYSRSLSDYLDKKLADNYRDPEDIPRLIEKIVTARHPKFRYIPEIESRVLLGLRKYLPWGLYSRLVLKEVFKRRRENGE